MQTCQVEGHQDKMARTKTNTYNVQRNTRGTTGLNRHSELTIVCVLDVGM